MLFRRNETAAVEITALAAGAGPPANKMATRRMFDSVWGGRDKVLVMSRSNLFGGLDRLGILWVAVAGIVTDGETSFAVADRPVGPHRGGVNSAMCAR